MSAFTVLALLSSLAFALGDQKQVDATVAAAPKARALGTQFRGARTPGGKSRFWWNNMAVTKIGAGTGWSQRGYGNRPWMPRHHAVCTKHSDCGFSSFCGKSPTWSSITKQPWKCSPCKSCTTCDKGIDNTCGGCHSGFPSKEAGPCMPTMEFVPCGAACQGKFTKVPIAASETTMCVATGYNSHVNQEHKDMVCNKRCHNIKKCRFFRPSCEKCSEHCICAQPFIKKLYEKEEEPTGKWSPGPARMLQSNQSYISV